MEPHMGFFLGRKKAQCLLGAERVEELLVFNVLLMFL